MKAKARRKEAEEAEEVADLGEKTRNANLNPRDLVLRLRPHLAGGRTIAAGRVPVLNSTNVELRLAVHSTLLSSGDDGESLVDQDYAAAAESLQYESTPVGAAVDLSLAIEIPPIVDAGPDTEDDEALLMPLPITPPSPTKAAPAVGAPQHRPRTSSAKERLPIFQVLCTDADEEYADGAPYPAPLQKVLSPSS